MGKFIDFILTDSWEEYQRVQMFKKIEIKLGDKNERTEMCKNSKN